VWGMDLHVPKPDLAVHGSESGRLPSGIPGPLRKAPCRVPCSAAQTGGSPMGLRRPEVAPSEGGEDAAARWRTAPARSSTRSARATTSDQPGRHWKSLRLSKPSTPIPHRDEKMWTGCEGFRAGDHIGAALGEPFRRKARLLRDARAQPPSTSGAWEREFHTTRRAGRRLCP
jgi:hypothetical protein